MEAWRMRLSYLICSLLTVHSSIILFPDTDPQLKMFQNRAPRGVTGSHRNDRVLRKLGARVMSWASCGVSKSSTSKRDISKSLSRGASM
jgi:hypothetical protein